MCVICPNFIDSLVQRNGVDYYQCHTTPKRKFKDTSVYHCKARRKVISNMFHVMSSHLCQSENTVFIANYGFQ